MVVWEKPVYLYVCIGLHEYGFSPQKEARLAMCDLLKTVKITIMARSIFLGHGYMQHAGMEWEGEHVMKYHKYIISTSTQIVDAVIFTYTWSPGAMDPAHGRSCNERQGSYHQWLSNAVTILDAPIIHLFVPRSSYSGARNEVEQFHTVKTIAKPLCIFV